MVPCKTCRNIPIKQQISPSNIHRPKRDINKFVKKESNLHKQKQIENRILVKLSDAKLKQRINKKVHHLLLCVDSNILNKYLIKWQHRIRKIKLYE